MVIQYKCPDCGADMSFDSTTGLLHCDSCGREEAIENMPRSQRNADAAIESEKNINWSTSCSHTEFANGQTKEYLCKNCGAVILTDADTTATSCSFCGAPVVLADRLGGTYAPAKVIPFTVDKKTAIDAFRKWCKRGLLTPSDFKLGDRIQSITGIYVPFFLYDLHSDATMNATCTKIRHYSSGEYDVTETRYYNVYREASIDYLKIPVDASKKMNDDMMDRLEPFDYQNLIDFQMPYLAGYLAEKYNYDEKELFPRVQKRAEKYSHDFLKNSIQGYNSMTVNYEHMNIQPQNAFYTLLPVWMVCYDYNKSEHTFAMNGQTGKVVGKPPISKAKALAFFFVLSVAFIAIQLIIEYIIRGRIL